MAETHAQLVRPSATYQDLEALPENLVGEIIAGELIASPRPNPWHVNITGEVYIDLGALFKRGDGGPGGWIILVEPELHLGEDVMVPDLAGWRRERLPDLPSTASVDLAPDWVCEVLSPSTALYDRATKLPRYGRHGVGHLWLIDPRLHSLEVFELREGRWTLLGVYAGDKGVRAPPFDAVELDMTRWWTA
ncbi:MAG: Uma2 family endonuclease [Alphaproteobacteria bacterium]|nr:Uma2 family endonuclease [Alphaproteobacteria bacterium]